MNQQSFRSRREWLLKALTSPMAFAALSQLQGCGGAAEDSVLQTAQPLSAPKTKLSNLASLGPLLPPNADGVRLPAGFTSRIVGRAGQAPSGNSAHVWHRFPDGATCVPDAGGGWLYVSNSEMDTFLGGVSVLKFSASGALIDSYSVCRGTSRNCAGGATPWGTYLSCEEIVSGRVWEVDPFTRNANARPLPMLGTFTHEAIAVDTKTRALYMSEDHTQGRFYRFVPTANDWPTSDIRASLNSGVLQALAYVNPNQPPQVTGVRVPVYWRNVIDPYWRQDQVRDPLTAILAGGEGVIISNGEVYLATKYDNRVYAYSPTDSTLRIVYDDNDYSSPLLVGVDNLETNGLGDVIVAEDGGSMQLVALLANGGQKPIVQVTTHPNSELTGPAFNPTGDKLYFSSQRGPSVSGSEGVTFEISGPFFVE